MIRQLLSPLVASLLLTGLVTPSNAAQEAFANAVPVSGPAALATDGLGHLFMLEQAGARVRKIDLSTGSISTVAGDGKNLSIEDGGKATDYFLGSMRSIAIDPQGNLLIGQGSRVRMVDAATGIITTVAGQFKSGKTIDGVAAADAQFWGIDGLAVNAGGDLFIADGLQRKIFRVDAATRILRTYAGNGRYGLSGDGGPALEASFEWANGIALNPYGDLVVADMNNCRIRWIDHSSGVINSIGSLDQVEASCAKRTTKPGGASSYAQPVVDSSRSVYVVDEAGDLLLRIDWDTSESSIVAGVGKRGYSGDSGPATQAELANPSGVAIDSEGNLFISEFSNNRIRRVDKKTQVITTFAGNGALHIFDSPIIQVTPTAQPRQDPPIPLADPFPLPVGPHD